jgi:hypothetical protein
MENLLSCHSGARAQHANPESITTSAAEYGFRARSLRERPGMTENYHGARFLF